jgi:hypothetical protein
MYLGHPQSTHNIIVVLGWEEKEKKGSLLDNATKWLWVDSNHGLSHYGFCVWGRWD